MEPNAEQRRPYHVYGRWKIGTGPAAILSPRRIEYLYMLFVHGMLDSDMIHALVSLALPPKPNEKPLKYRVVADDLRLMRDRPNVHVRVPDAFIDEKDTNANLIYEITPCGVEALLDAGRISFDDFQFWTKYQTNYKERHFAHDVATAFISASLDLGVRAIGGRWIPAWEMIQHPKCPAETQASPNPFALPYKIEGKRHVVVPDQIGVLDTPSAFNFTVIETDKGNEQHKEKDTNTNTLNAKWRAYDYVLENKTYKVHFGASQMRVIVATPHVLRMRNMMANKARMEGAHDDRYLFQAIPALSRKSSERLEADARMFTTPYQRVDGSTVDLSKGE